MTVVIKFGNKKFVVNDDQLAAELLGILSPNKKQESRPYKKPNAPIVYFSHI